MDKKIPNITSTLINYLEEIYPMKSPALTDSERDIFFNVGIQEVISKLKKLKEEQKTKYNK